MPFGEMTFSLDDVDTLVGIPVEGRSVRTPQEGFDSAKTMLVVYLV